jgi:hypothetical protein
MTQEQIIADYKKARHITDEYVLDEDEMYFVEQIYFLHQEQVKNCSIPVVIGRLQSLNRFDLDPIFNGEFTELEERKELDGTFVKWDDVEKLINGLKTDNAL